MKKIKYTGGAITGIGMLAMIIAVIIKQGPFVPILGIAGLLIFCSGCIYFLIFWRCPYCHRHLPTQGMIGMTHCPYCGTELDN